MIYVDQTIMLDPNASEYRKTVGTLLGVHLYLTHYMAVPFDEVYDEWKRQLGHQGPRLVQYGEIFGGLLAVPVQSLGSKFWQKVELYYGAGIEVVGPKVIGTNLHLPVVSTCSRSASAFRFGCYSSSPGSRHSPPNHSLRPPVARP